MTTLKHDERGFLVGELIQIGEESRELQRSGNRVQKQMAKDIRAIARYYGLTPSLAQPPATPVARGSRAATPVEPGLPAGTSPRSRGGATHASAAAAAVRRTNTSAAVTPNVRDSRGRFVGGGSKNGGGGHPESDGAGDTGRLSGAVDRLTDSLRGTEQIDPAIAAANEVREVVEPLGRGLKFMFGRSEKQQDERKKARWYTRIINAIKGKKDGGSTAVVETQSPGVFGRLFGGIFGGADSILGFLGGILRSVFLPVAAAWASWSVGQWIGKNINDWLNENEVAQKIEAAFKSVGEFLNSLIPNFLKPKGASAGENSPAQQAQQNQIAQSSGVQNNFARVQGDIIAASKKAGVDPGVVAQIMGYESGFNQYAKAKGSSASGLGQFIDGTWVSTMRKYGEKYGSDTTGMSDAQILALKGDRRLQAGMTAELTRENVELGRKIGGSNDVANVYALHNLGNGDGRKFLSALRDNPNAPVSSILGAKVIANNPDLYQGGGISVSEAYSRMGSRMAKYAPYAAMARRSAGIAVMPESPAMPSIAAVPSGANVPALAASSITAAPEIKMPSSTGDGNRPLSINVESDVGQNVSDRGIAHVVTGGLGSYGFGS